MGNDDCSCLDTPLCSLKKKAFIFAIYTMVLGGVVLLASILFIVFSYYSYNLYAEIIICFSVIHIGGGLCLFFGYQKNMAELFLAGIIISSFLPFILLMTIIIPAVQVLFIITSVRYYKQM